MNEFEKIMGEYAKSLIESLDDTILVNLLTELLYLYGFIELEDMNFLSKDNKFSKEQIFIISPALKSGWMNMEQVKKYIDPSLEPFRINAIQHILHFRYPSYIIDIIKSKKYSQEEIDLVIESLYVGLDISDIYIFLNRDWSVKKKSYFKNALLFKMPFSMLERLMPLSDRIVDIEVSEFIEKKINLKINEENLNIDYERAASLFIAERMGIEKENIDKYMTKDKSIQDLSLITGILRYIHNDRILSILMKYVYDYNKMGSLVNFFLTCPSLELLEKLQYFSSEQCEFISDIAGYNNIHYLLKNVLTPNLSLEEMTEKIIKIQGKQNND